MGDQKDSQNVREHRWYKYRNRYGEVVACVKKIETPDTFPPPLAVGFAFSNPADFNLPRAIRVQKGQGLSYHRMVTNPIIIRLPTGSTDSYEKMLVNTAINSTYRLIKEYLLRPYNDQNQSGIDLKVKSYEGQKTSGFDSWFWDFKEELRKSNIAK